MEHDFIKRNSSGEIYNTASPNFIPRSIIGQYLASPQGRQRLAGQPIRRSLDYQGIARKALAIEPLPQGALPLYDRDIDVSAVVLNDDDKCQFVHDEIIISSNGKIGQRGQLSFPKFEIINNPTIKLSDIKQRRFSLIERTMTQQILAKEYEEIFKVLDDLAKNEA